MQSLLFLRATDDGPIDRIINLELMSMAAVDPDNKTGTVVHVGQSIINMGMSFERFREHVERLVAENYRISIESSAQWHKKRMDDIEQIMRSAMGGH